MLLEKFYQSSKSCEDCKSPLYKSVFHKDCFADLGTGLQIPFVRIFTCLNCKCIIIPYPGFEIAFKNYYKIMYGPVEYEKEIIRLNNNGSTEGRSGYLITIDSLFLAESLPDNELFLDDMILGVMNEFEYRDYDQIKEIANSGIKIIKGKTKFSFIDD